MDIVSLVGSQLTKNGTTEVKYNRTPTEYDGLWVRPDKANLVLAPRIIYRDDPDGTLDEEGNVKRVPTGQGLISILKNSEGSKGDAPVIPEFERLQWVNGKNNNYKFGED